MKTAREILRTDLKLPSPPAIAVQILNAVKNEHSSFEELARLLSADPALTARVLRLANSSYYGLSQPVDRLTQAVALLGADVLKNLALSFVIVRDMQGPDREGFDFHLFWKRSVTAAVAAEQIAGLIRQDVGDLFASALLQDIGVVVLRLERKESYERVFDEKRASGRSLHTVEAEVLGLDHSQVGFEMLRLWGIPESISVPIGHHHRPDEAPKEFRMASRILGLSDKVSSVYHGTSSAGKVSEITRELTDGFHVPQERIDGMIDSVAEKSREILQTFDLEPGDLRPFSQILQEANEELGKLNVSYEHLVVELKQAHEKAERFARELRDANGRLRERAERDGLTGLYNHRYFKEAFTRELVRAARYGRTFSLLLFDIDHFKKVNDRYGHPRGDLVLQAIGRETQALIRGSDMAARYGGEEFTVILPETEIQGGAVLAERLRKKVEALTVTGGGKTIRVTISVGLTTYEPGCGNAQPADLIDAADRALYNSKESGRNRVSILKLG